MYKVNTITKHYQTIVVTLETIKFLEHIKISVFSCTLLQTGKSLYERSEAGNALREIMPYN